MGHSRIPWLLLAALLLGLGCAQPLEDERPISTTALLFDGELGGGFWSYPFPSDLRVTTEGAPAVAGFPNPTEAQLIDTYSGFIEANVRGFGRSAPIYFAFDGEVSLPPWDEDAAFASMRCEGPVRILDVDPASPDYGRCLPARWTWTDASNLDVWLQPNMLTVSPVWGFPMRNLGSYAVYLVDVPGPGGYLRPPDRLAQLLAGEGAGDEQAIFQPLVACLADSGPEGDPTPACPGAWGERSPEWIAAATVFHTQDATGELRRAADFVRTSPDEPRWSGLLEPLEPEDDHYQQAYRLWSGSYTAHNFQRGEIPYANEGGGFVLDPQGVPVPQSVETIPFALAEPVESFSQPESGWPVLIHAHGTGGDRFSHFGGGGTEPALMAARRGFLSVGIPQPFHGDRWPEGGDLAIQLNSFNFFNPESGRSTFRQGALDSVALLRFIEEQLGAGGAIAEAHPELRIDPARIYFIGHSQGGITGSLALPFLDGLQAAVISGAGGGLAMTIIQRREPDILALLSASLQAPERTEFTDVHPVMGLVQLLVEVTDPLYYGPLWYAEGEGSPKSVLLTEGILDAATPADTSEALATAARLPIARPFEQRSVLGLQLRALESSRVPYSGNVTHVGGEPVTVGLAQFDANHFAIFNEPSAATLWANFLYSHAQDGAPGELGYEF